MSDIAIRVENLSKLYHIGELHQRHDTLRDALADSFSRMIRMGRKNIRIIRPIRVNMKIQSGR
jgi:hypothetical protein